MPDTGDHAAPGAGRDPYEVVFDVSATLTASLDLDELLPTIARRVCRALDVQTCDINEYDREANTMTYTAVWSEDLSADDLAYIGTVVDLAERPGRDAVIRKGDLLEAYVDDVDLDPTERDLMIEYDEYGVLEMPLVYGGEAIGVLGIVESRHREHFSDEKKLLLRLLAGPAAIAIGNARAYRAQREQARRTAALLAASRTMASAIDLDEVLERVAQSAVDVVNGSQSVVYEYLPDLDAIVYRTLHIRVPVPSDAPRDDEVGTVYPLRDYPGERAHLQAGRVVQEHRSDPDLPADRRESMDAWHEQTCLSLPLRFGDTPLGILRLYDMVHERHYADDELDLLRSLAKLASTALYNARLFNSETRHSARLLELFEVSRDLSTAFDPGSLAATLLAGTLGLVGDGVEVEIWLRDGGGPGDADAAGTLRPAAWSDEAAGEPAVPGDVARAALATVQPSQRADDDVSELAVPFVARGRAEGLAMVRTKRRRVFNGAEVEALQVLANQAAVALENVRLYQQVEQQAVRDGLTGLYNHRFFQDRLSAEVTRARRYELPLSLLILDIDDFKQFNDTYGHPLGDTLLREIAGILEGNIRRGVDFAARYGGEEFVIILPHTSADGPATTGAAGAGAGDAAAGAGDAGAGAGGGAADEGAGADRRGAVPSAADAPPAGTGALVVAERLRKAIGERRFAAGSGRGGLHVTVTIGAATLRHTTDGPKELIRDADKALYVGKRSGKDRVELNAD